MKKINEKGVTLIALVVTVIVLLILAGVSITAAIGDHDKAVVSKAYEAREDTEIAAQGEDEVVKEILNEINDNQVISDKFSITFVDGDNNILTTITQKNGTVISYPSNAPTPTKASTAAATYTFSGKWATDAEGTNIVDLSTITTSDRLYAVFNKSAVTYTVTFKDYDSTTLATVSVAYEGTAVYPKTTPTRSGYTFTKWVTTQSGSTAATLTDITESKTVYAYYTTNAVCFAARTKVLTENGLLNIEDLQVGMKVLSFNEETKEVELKTVLNTFRTEAYKDMVKVYINGEVIESTSNHPYFEITKGWIGAKELEVGDRVLNALGEEVIIEKVEFFENSGIDLKVVYNLEVEDNHNYFVGENNILVHNISSHSGGTNC